MALIFIDGKYSHIECDACGKRAPLVAEMIANHGLSNMGWFVAGGKHRCAKHYTHDTPTNGPIYRTKEEQQ